jgi:hypothetical protein
MREKLIELLIETAPMDYKDSADYLIAHGVTIQDREEIDFDYEAEN